MSWIRKVVTKLSWHAHRPFDPRRQTLSRYPGFGLLRPAVGPRRPPPSLAHLGHWRGQPTSQLLAFKRHDLCPRHPKSAQGSNKEIERLPRLLPKMRGELRRSCEFRCKRIQVAVGFPVDYHQTVYQFRRWPVGNEMNGELARQVARCGRMSREIRDDGPDIIQARLFAPVTAAQDLLGSGFGADRAENFRIPRAVGKPRQQLSQLSHICLAVVGPYTQAVKFKHLAREVLV